MKTKISIYWILLFIQTANHVIGTIEYFNCSIICRNGLQICGLGCYDPKESECYDDVICENGLKKCGFGCYDPRFYTCFDVINCKRKKKKNKKIKKNKNKNKNIKTKEMSFFKNYY